uniref:L-ascorbate oxidase n=1 Tax=Tanacetum cinerariifolium TaxID=118510 RepID=A0A699GZM2_TANCI|nr:L-ascorbate oxidase [Tanacetum cinerariifolium]
MIGLCALLLPNLILNPVTEARTIQYNWGTLSSSSNRQIAAGSYQQQFVTGSVSILWHGIKQFGSPSADGTASFTQCPILPGETFNYTFAVDRAGTFMYHAHYEMQQESGLYGMIKVSLLDGETEPFSYDYERRILLNDWYHKSTNEHATGLSSIPYVWVGDPQYAIGVIPGKELTGLGSDA